MTGTVKLTTAAEALGARYNADPWFIATRPNSGAIDLHVTAACQFDTHRTVMGYAVRVVKVGGAK